MNRFDLARIVGLKIGGKNRIGCGGTPTGSPRVGDGRRWRKAWED